MIVQQIIRVVFWSGVLLSAPLCRAQSDEVLQLINEVREAPQTFLHARLIPYLKANGMESNSYAQSLIEELKSAAKGNPLKASPVLEKLAQGHARDMGEHDQVGHESSNGATFVERLRKKIRTGLIAENCDYGHTTGLDIVMALLIDDGITSLGHRKNIMNPALKWIGIAVEKHKTYRINCVMDFASAI